MSIPNYLYALANQKDPATITAGGLNIPVKIRDIEHESSPLTDRCAFKCLVVNADQIVASGSTAVEKIANPRTKSVGPFAIKNVYFNDPVTVVIWADGTKTIVRCQDGDTYSKETGLAMCFAKKALGNKGGFNDVFHKWIPEEEPAVEPRPSAKAVADFNEELRRMAAIATRALMEGRHGE